MTQTVGVVHKVGVGVVLSILVVLMNIYFEDCAKRSMRKRAHLLQSSKKIIFGHGPLTASGPLVRCTIVTPVQAWTD